jgi:hypothetical protein
MIAVTPLPTSYRAFRFRRATKLLRMRNSDVAIRNLSADRAGYELLTFECPNCKHIETAVRKTE